MSRNIFCNLEQYVPGQPVAHENDGCLASSVDPFGADWRQLEIFGASSRETHRVIELNGIVVSADTRVPALHPELDGMQKSVFEQMRALIKANEAVPANIASAAIAAIQAKLQCLMDYAGDDVVPNSLQQLKERFPNGDPPATYEDGGLN